MSETDRREEEKLYTIEQAGRLLREYAEMTANHSQNWDNFQRIAETALAGAFGAGKTAKAREAQALGSDSVVSDGGTKE